MSNLPKDDGTILTLGLVGAVAAAGALLSRRGSANHLVVGEKVKLSASGLKNLGSSRQSAGKGVRGTVIEVDPFHMRSAGVHGYRIVITKPGAGFRKGESYSMEDHSLVAADSKTRKFPGTGYQGVKPKGSRADNRGKWPMGTSAKLGFEIVRPSVRTGLANLSQKLREKINAQMRKKGLDGNGRYRKPEIGYMRAVEIMQDNGIELDEVVSSFQFTDRPRGTVKAMIAFSNDRDVFSPVPISNSMLFLQFYELRKDTFEVVAYLS